MSKKETARIVKFIEQGKEPAVVVKCTVQDAVEFAQVLEGVAKECNKTIVLLVSAVEATNTLLAGVSIPEEHMQTLGTWLTTSVAPVSFPGSSVEFLSSSICKIRYQQDSEHFAFKLVDVVSGQAFHELKKLGLYAEPEEEKEYNFDDMEL